MSEIQPDKYTGQLVEVSFYDHVEGDGVTDVLECKVWGRLIESTWQKLVIRQWESMDDFSVNNTNVVLVRAAVTAIQGLHLETPE